MRQNITKSGRKEKRKRIANLRYQSFFSRSLFRQVRQVSRSYSDLQKYSRVQIRSTNRIFLFLFFFLQKQNPVIRARLRFTIARIYVTEEKANLHFSFHPRSRRLHRIKVTVALMHQFNPTHVIGCDKSLFSITHQGILVALQFRYECNSLVFCNS